MTYFTSEQLQEASGKTARTLRTHVHEGWLKAEPKAPGIRGHRFTKANAQKWLERHYPGKTLPA